ncbi:MAG: Trehalose utilization, partial [Prosthecobacter sp.]|nr:Trehalose utilization [Prosthecobacter sp.]
GILAKRGEKTVIKAAVDGAKKTVVEVTGTVGESAAIQAAIKKEDWNEYRIVAKGNHVQHFINGMQTIDVTDEDAANAPKEGLLALQIHAGPPMVVQFKNFKLVESK